MIWTMYRVIFRLLAPLHVGHFKQGNLQRTRLYVTGQTLWGALTARLVRDFGGEYDEVGKQVNEQLALSYFYPSSDPSKVTLFPWQDEEKFAWLYLNTYASTALNYSQNIAEEASLHETEYIAPCTRDGEPVYLVGYLFERKGCELQWRQVLNRLQLGGERTYGWGRVACDENSIQPPEKFFDGWQVDLNADRPRLQPHNDASLYAHLQYSSAVQVKGQIEPFLGRRTQQAEKHGNSLSPATVCWMPGSKAEGVNSVKIGEFGIWKQVNASI